MESRHITSLSPLFRGSLELEPIQRVQPTHQLNGLNRHTKRLVDHARYMGLALRLARKAVGHTSPNPMVGAVIVKDRRIIGQGYHRRAGAPHAEVEALRKAGPRTCGATLYVTLEPCNHAGRTPPCCDAILTAGISCVVIATKDPNPLTNGRGVARLRRAGIRVVTGVLEQEAQQLNEPFRKAMISGIPFVIAKVGQSLDGKIATTRGESRWITSPAARRLGHQWRSRVDAILVGVRTVLRDDPLLAVRGAAQRPGRPVKIIVDSRLRTPHTARCLSAQSPAPSLIATTVRTGTKRAALVRRSVELLTLPAQQGRVPLRRLCRLLARRGIQSILIEGGGEVLASAFAERLVDRIAFFIAPMLIGGRTAPASVGGIGVSRLAHAIRLDDVTYRRVGPDLCVEGRVVYPKGAGGRRRGAGGTNRRVLVGPHAPPARRSRSPGRARPTPLTRFARSHP
jgi:diaminohydroxyphosphoribosylaminopyrimidine deaminase/5-amino-6-(5-phosphoribosylamino)uracil reductase